MKTNYLVGLAGVLLFLTSIATQAELTCNKCPPLDEVHCETSFKGPLFNHWEWTASNAGSFYGSWKTADGYPYRKWDCNGQDAATDFSVVSIFYDGTFEFEIIYDLRCRKIFTA